MKSIRVSHLNFTLLICLIISLVLVKTYRWDGHNGLGKKYVIDSDGKGYYAHLPALFIDQDQGQDDLKKNSTYTNNVDGKTINKYFVGTSILMSPFFGIAHASAKIFNYAPDGYSSPYQFMIVIASVFYLFLGLFCLFKLLKLFNISDINSTIAVILTFLGTNLLYYSIVGCSMSHVYSFSIISCFALTSKKLLKTHHIKYIYLSAIFLAIIVLIRPTNGIVFILPLLLSNNLIEFKKIWSALLKQWKHIFISILILLIILSVQPLIWYKQSGSFFVWSYSDEGFYFLNPQIFNVLFSFRKGLFIYTPLILISLAGLIIVFNKNKFWFYGFLSFFLIITYIISSWWNWYYGDSFGLRAYIDYFFIFCLLLALLLENFKKRPGRILLMSALTLCTIINVIQSYQYYAGIMHRYSMNADKYWHIFLKTSDKYKNRLGGNIDVEPYSRKPKELIYSTLNDFETGYSEWTEASINNQNLCASNTQWSRYYIYEFNEFGPALEIKQDSLFHNSRKIYVEASLERLEPENCSSSQALFVIDVRSKQDKSLYYHSFKINDYPGTPKCTWKKYHYTFEIPKLKSYDDKIMIYLWNKEHQKFLIDNFKLDFYRIY